MSNSVSIKNLYTVMNKLYMAILLTLGTRAVTVTVVVLYVRVCVCVCVCVCALVMGGNLTTADPLPL